MRDPALLAVKRPATQLCWRSFRLDPLKPPLDAVDPSEKRGRALVCCGVELSDLPGGLGQVGVIQLCRHIVFFGLVRGTAKAFGRRREPHRVGFAPQQLPAESAQQARDEYGSGCPY